MPEIYFQQQEQRVMVPEGTTILAAARLAGILIESPCDGIGTCGKCLVRLVDAAPGSYHCEQAHYQLSADQLAEGMALACHTQVLGDITVLAADTEKQNRSLKIVSGGAGFEYPLDPWITKQFADGRTRVFAGDHCVGEEDGDTTEKLYGLAIDIGTTTLVAALVNLRTGKELASLSALNPQSLHAQDVITRIHMASKPAGLKLLHDVIRDAFNHMIGELCQQTGVAAEHIYEVIYSGNTTMLHLACNVNPELLGQFPYTAVMQGGNTLPAGELMISPFGDIYLPPIISAYVGPDITSGVLAGQLEKKPGTTLFIDIGTNGEMILAQDGRLAGTSTAAGPAFEGMNITCGMRAGDGALEFYQIGEDGSTKTHVLGDGEAIGICGSGLLDIIGELVRVGVIGKTGRLIRPAKGTYPEALKAHMKEKDGKPVFYVTKNVYITQADIRQVQLAKGAVRAGVEMLMASLGVAPEKVDCVQIAGSFGYHLQESSLLNQGMLPAAFRGKVEFVGNTSQSGARAFLTNRGTRAYMEDVVKDIRDVELSQDPEFQNVFVRALGF